MNGINQFPFKEKDMKLKNIFFISTSNLFTKNIMFLLNKRRIIPVKSKFEVVTNKNVIANVFLVTKPINKLTTRLTMNITNNLPCLE
jgi:hypothetical protein